MIGPLAQIAGPPSAGPTDYAGIALILGGVAAIVIAICAPIVVWIQVRSSIKLEEIRHNTNSLVQARVRAAEDVERKRGEDVAIALLETNRKQAGEPDGQ